MDCVGRDFRDHLVPNPPPMGRDTIIETGLLRVMFNLAWNTSRVGASATSLGILPQCLNALTAPNVFLIFNQSLFSSLTVIPPCPITISPCRKVLSSLKAYQQISLSKNPKHFHLQCLLQIQNTSMLSCLTSFLEVLHCGSAFKIIQYSQAEARGYCLVEECLFYSLFCDLYISSFISACIISLWNLVMKGAVRYL